MHAVRDTMADRRDVTAVSGAMAYVYTMATLLSHLTYIVYADTLVRRGFACRAVAPYPPYAPLCAILLINSFYLPLECFPRRVSSKAQ